MHKESTYGYASTITYYSRIVSMDRIRIKSLCRAGQKNLVNKNYHFLFLLPFDPKALKTCKNTENFQFVSSWLSVLNTQ